MKRYIKEVYFVGKVNPHFRAWMKAIGLQPGDEWKPSEYMIWINQKVAEFKKDHGLQDFQPIMQLDQFTSFLEAHEPVAMRREA